MVEKSDAYLGVEATLKALFAHGYVIRSPRASNADESALAATVAAAAAPRVTTTKLAEQMALRENLAHPPTTTAVSGDLPEDSWKLAPGKSTCCFLSHFKQEAASDARYLKDALESMVGAPVWLDSDNIIDLSNILTNVSESEVLLFLQTTNILSRPW